MNSILNLRLRSAAFILIFFSVSVAGLYAGDYEDARSLYKSKEYARALDLFLQFARENPTSKNWDNALYYAARIELNAENPEAAEQHFSAIVSKRKGSHYKLALLKLVRMLNEQGRRDEVVAYLATMRLNDPDSSNEVRLRHELAKASYSIGRRERSRGDFVEAAPALYRAAKAFEFVRDHGKEEVRQDAGLSAVRAYRHLVEVFAITEESDKAESARESGRSALVWLKSADVKGKYTKRIAALEKELEKKYSKWGVDGDIKLAGGGAFLGMLWGADASLDLDTYAELGNRTRFIMNTGYRFDSFSKKTFGFPSATRNDLERRMYQMAHEVDFGLIFKHGSRSDLYNKFSIEGDFDFPEDTDDYAIKAAISNDLSWRAHKHFRFDLDLGANFAYFPNYGKAGRKLDYVSGGAEPLFRIYATDAFFFDIGYEFNYKYYLDALYDTAEQGVSSEATRQYMTHSGKVGIGADVGKIWDFSLMYEPSYLKTLNYDRWVTFLDPADEQFVQGYFDKLTHEVKLKNDLLLGKVVKIGLDAFISVADYDNYPARNAQQQNINELRRDIRGGVDAGVDFIVHKNVSIFITTEWEKQLSNMEYDSFYATNYDWLKSTAGLHISF